MRDTENLGALDCGLDVGHKTALTDCRNWESPFDYTHDEINQTADAIARGLLKRGLKSGNRVAILSANRAEFLLAFLGILRAGLVAVPFSHQFAPDIVSFILNDADVSYAFCDGPRAGVLPANLQRTNFDSTDNDSFEALLDHGLLTPSQPADDLAMILYTSGSTGRPKGVPLTHEGHLWALRRRIAGSPPDDHRLLVAAPLYHMNALCVSLYALATGAHEVLLPEFKARRYLEAIERFGCTWITSVPTMIAMCFADEAAIAKADVSTVRSVRMGSAPVSPKLWEQVAQKFAGASIMNGYGTTEAGPIVFSPKPGKTVPPISVGFPAAEVDLKLIDDNGNEANQGVLWHRTPATMPGYLNLPEKTAEVLTPDGWYISGDVFRRDENGAYFFVGRADDMFNCGGENIYPGEVEATLVSHPDITQACVVPVPDEIKGFKPVAFVVAPGAKLTEAAVKEFTLQRAPAFQHPRTVTFLEALPLAGPGKIDRKSLTQQAEAAWSKMDAED